MFANRVDHSIDADSVVETFEAILAVRAAPGHLRTANGPELTADTIGNWCKPSGTATAYIEPGAPWENGHIESFNGRLRDAYLDTGTSPTCSKPVSSSRTGDTNTTTTGHTDHSAGSPPPRTLNNATDNTHNNWTDNQVPVSPPTCDARP